MEHQHECGPKGPETTTQAFSGARHWKELAAQGQPSPDRQQARPKAGPPKEAAAMPNKVAGGTKTEDGEQVGQRRTTFTIGHRQRSTESYF